METLLSSIAKALRSRFAPFADLGVIRSATSCGRAQPSTDIPGRESLMVLDGMAKRVLPLGNLRTCHADGSRHGRKKPEEKQLTLFVYCHLRILEDACKFLALGATCVNIRDGLFVRSEERRVGKECRSW